MRNNRSLKNAFVRPQAQIRFAVLCAAAAAIALSVYMMILLFVIFSTFMSTAQMYNLPTELTDSLHRSLYFALTSVGLLGLGLTLIMLAVGVIVGHRIYGPLVPLQNLIAKLSSGDYQARGSLRKNDHFVELMDSLNGLATSLEAREKSSKG